jgi:Fe2+ or Zn2+ uptake regulation protein
VCKECERVERISSCTLDGIEQSSLKSSRKFISLERHALQLVGVCKSCA